MARSISFDIAALDKASKVLTKVGDEVSQIGRKIDRASGTIEIDADTAAATAGIRQVEAQMARLEAKRLKVDADVTDAERQLQILQAERDKVAGTDAQVKVDADITRAQQKLAQLRAERVAVDADTTAAEAKLTALHARARELDGKNVTVKADVDVDRGVSATQRLERGLQSIAAWGERLGRSVASGALSMATGLGMVALKAGVLIAVLAELQSAALSVSAAIAGIGAVGVAGFATLQAGFTGIGDALTAMDAKATGGGAAVKATATDVKAAAQGVKDAEADLRNAQVDERIAQEDLTRAREDAARTLRDLELQTEDMALAQKDAGLSTREAEEAERELRKSGTATGLQLERAALRVAEARQREKDLSAQALDLANRKADADLRGVEGSDQVVAAGRRVQDSHRAVEDAVIRLAQAQQQLNDTIHPKAGGGGVDKLAEAFGNLGPKAQQFATYLKGFIDGPLTSLRQAGQEAFLPQIEAGMKKLPSIMKDTEPAFAQFSAHLGKVVADLMPELAKLAKPFLHFADEALKGLEAGTPGLKQWLAKVGKWFEDMAGSGQAKAKTKEFIDQVVAGARALPGFLTQVKATLDDMKIVLDELVGIIQTIDGWRAKWAGIMDGLPRPPGFPARPGSDYQAEFLTQPKGSGGGGGGFRGMSAPMLAPEPDPGLAGRWATWWGGIESSARQSADGIGSRWTGLQGQLSGIVSGIGSWISQQWTAMHSWLSSATQTGLAWISQQWTGLGTTLTGAVTGLGAWISQQWTSMHTTLSSATQTGLAWISQQWTSLVSTVQGIPGRIAGALRSMWQPLWDSFKAILNQIISGWNRLRFTVPSFSLPGLGQIGGGSFGVTPIQPLATGGIVTRPTLALVGEAGPEAVVPLRGRNAAAAGIGGPTVEIHLHGILTDAGAVARGVAEGLQTAVRQGLLPPSVLGGAAS